MLAEEISENSSVSAAAGPGTVPLPDVGVEIDRAGFGRHGSKSSIKGKEVKQTPVRSRFFLQRPGRARSARQRGDPCNGTGFGSRWARRRFSHSEWALSH